MDNFVTLMTFTHPTELAVLRARMENDEIECRVLNELTVQVNPFYSNAVGGVKLQVKESDLGRATQILKDGGYINEEGASVVENQFEPESDSSLLKCSECGSTDVVKNKLSGKMFALTILLLGFPLPFLRRAFHCFNCGKDFKKGDK